MMSVATTHNATDPTTQERVLFRVLDFSCAGEAAGLERRLHRVAGVRHVTVNPLNETAYVSFDPVRTNVAELEFVASAAGYRVE